MVLSRENLRIKGMLSKINRPSSQLTKLYSEVLRGDEEVCADDRILSGMKTQKYIKNLCWAQLEVVVDISVSLN